MEFEQKEAVEIGEYNGNPVITINEGYPHTFGLKKAENIVKHIDAIKEFVEKNK